LYHGQAQPALFLLLRRFATPPSSPHDNPAPFTTLSLLFCDALPLNQALPLPPSHHFESSGPPIIIISNISNNNNNINNNKDRNQNTKKSEKSRNGIFCVGIGFLAGLGLTCHLDMPHEESSAT
jgi:hypothetical protein